MTWSLLTPKVRAVLVASEAQRNEPGINQVDNCGPACVACLMMIHGYPDIEPQDLVGPYYRGGTTGPQLNAIIANRYPNPPAMAYVTSADPIGDLARWAAQGFLSIGLFWSDGAAVVKPYNTGIGHWCMPIEDDGTSITYWNPEWASFDRLSHSDFLKASWRQFDVCQRPISKEDIMSIEQATAIARMMLLAALPSMTYQQASSNPPQGYGDWVGLIAAALMPGSGKDAAQLLAQFIAGLPKSGTAAGQAGPQGPPGPKGDPGKDGSALDLTKLRVTSTT